MTKDQIVVMKFNSSAFKDTNGFKRAAKIIKEEKRKKIVTVSAMWGITDELFELVALATMTGRTNFKNNEPSDTLKKYREIWSKYLKVLRELDVRYRPDRMDDGAREIEKVLDMISYMKQAPPVLTAAVVSKGETFSAIVLSAYLSEHSYFTYLPAREFIITDDNFLNANILMDATRLANINTASYPKDNNNNTLVTENLVGGTLDKRTTLLDQNGPDNATIFDCIINGEK